MKKRVAAYLFCNGVSQVGDAFFLFYLVLWALDLPHGGVLSGFLFSLDALVKVFFSPITAKWVDQIAYTDRWRWSLLGSFVLVLIALLPGIISPAGIGGYVWMAVLLTIMLVVSNVSSQLRMEMPYRLASNGIFSLSKFTSIANLSFRGVYFIAPMIAAMIPKGYWVKASLVNSASFCFASVASVLGMKFFSKLILSRGTRCANDEVDGAVKRLARWSNILLFLLNLAMGGIALLLTDLLKNSSDPIYRIISPISILYLGMVITLIIVMTAPKIRVIEHATINLVLIITMGTFMVLMLSSALPPNLFLAGICIVGSLYGASIVTMSPAIVSHFSKCNAMTTYASHSQAYGKIGTITSSLLVGMLIDYHYNPYHILFFLGLLGSMFVVALSILKKRWEIIW